MKKVGIVLVLSLMVAIILCGCGGRNVPDEMIYDTIDSFLASAVIDDYGIVDIVDASHVIQSGYDEYQVDISHKWDNKTKTDTVTVTLTIKYDYVTDTKTGQYVYKYDDTTKSWSLPIESSWETTVSEWNVDELLGTYDYVGATQDGDIELSFTIYDIDFEKYEMTCEYNEKFNGITGVFSGTILLDDDGYGVPGTEVEISESGHSYSIWLSKTDGFMVVLTNVLPENF